MGLSNWLVLPIYPHCQMAVLDAMVREAGKFAKLIELAALNNVNGIRNREPIPYVFILDMIFLDMEHVDAKDMSDGAMEEG